MKKLLNNTKTRKKDKGVAGLEVLLSLVVMLFVIGFLVMIFALMGGELSDEDSIEASEGPNQVWNETVTLPASTAGVTLTTCGTVTNGVATISSVTNATNGTNLVAVSNYTIAKCVLRNTGPTLYNGSNVNVSYTYVYSGTAFDVINGTSDEISNVTDWFGIIIVIGAMVVLILLTVIIISAIRGTGLVGGMGSASNPSKTTA